MPDPFVHLVLAANIHVAAVHRDCIFLYHYQALHGAARRLFSSILGLNIIRLYLHDLVCDYSVAKSGRDFIK